MHFGRRRVSGPSTNVSVRSAAIHGRRRPQKHDPAGRLQSHSAPGSFLGWAECRMPTWPPTGAKIFGPTCGFCHGVDARGGSAPDLLRSAVVLDDNQGELIGPTVHDGRPTKGMPAFPSFTEEQLRDIAEYLHLQVELAANRGTYKTLNIVTGDAKAGEAYFNGAGKCNTCHSVTGDLAHLGSKMSPPDLQQTFLYPAPRHRPPAKVTVTLADGKKMSGTLKHLDDFYVSLYDARGQLPVDHFAEGDRGGGRR